MSLKTDVIKEYNGASGADGKSSAPGALEFVPIGLQALNIDDYDFNLMPPELLGAAVAACDAVDREQRQREDVHLAAMLADGSLPEGYSRLVGTASMFEGMSYDPDKKERRDREATEQAMRAQEQALERMAELQRELDKLQEKIQEIVKEIQAQEGEAIDIISVKDKNGEDLKVFLLEDGTLITKDGTPINEENGYDKEYIEHVREEANRKYQEMTPAEQEKHKKAGKIVQKKAQEKEELEKEFKSASDVQQVAKARYENIIKKYRSAENIKDSEATQEDSSPYSKLLASSSAALENQPEVAVDSYAALLGGSSDVSESKSEGSEGGDSYEEEVDSYAALLAGSSGDPEKGVLEQSPKSIRSGFLSASEGGELDSYESLLATRAREQEVAAGDSPDQDKSPESIRPGFLSAVQHEEPADVEGPVPQEQDSAVSVAETMNTSDNFIKSQV